MLTLIIIVAAAAAAVIIAAVWLGGKTQCRNCGFYIPRRAPICPSCGCERKKPRT